MGSCDIIVNHFWSAKMRLYFLGIMVTMGGQVSAQRRQFIQDLITRLKNSPGPQSSSPSWSSERQFEVIAPGYLPLQNHKIQDEFEGELLESKYVPDLPSSRIQENSDNRENRRSKRSPYKNIKIKIGNPFADSPFYYNGKKPRRRVRVKQVLAARPAHTR